MISKFQELCVVREIAWRAFSRGVVLVAISLFAATYLNTGRGLANEAETPVEESESAPDIGVATVLPRHDLRLQRHAAACLIVPPIQSPGINGPPQPAPLVGHRLSNGLSAPLRC